MPKVNVSDEAGLGNPINIFSFLLFPETKGVLGSYHIT